MEVICLSKCIGKSRNHAIIFDLIFNLKKKSSEHSLNYDVKQPLL